MQRHESQHSLHRRPTRAARRQRLNTNTDNPGAAGAAPIALTSPEKFFGFQMGADRKLANWDKLHEYLPAARQELESRQAGRARQVERGPALHRAVHLVAGEPGEARSAAADQREVRRPARALGGRRQEADGRRQGGDHPELRAALDRSGRGADGGRVRLRLPDAHRRRVDAHSRQRDQHRAAVDQPGRHADGGRLVHEVCRHAVRGVEPALAVPEVLRPRQQPRRLRAQPARVEVDRQADVPRLAAAGLHGPSPDGQRQRAHRDSAVCRADSSRTAIRWCGARSTGLAATWAPSSKRPARPA